MVDMNYRLISASVHQINKHTYITDCNVWYTGSQINVTFDLTSLVNVYHAS